MPKGGISLYFSMQDRASTVLKAIGDNTKVLDKETQSLAQAAEALTAANKPLIEQQSELKIQLEANAKAVKEARKAFQEYGDETRRATLQSALDEQSNLQRKLKDTEDQLRSNQKTYQDYREAIRKGTLEEESLGGSSGGGMTDNPSFLKNFAASGVLKQFSDSLSGAASSYITSAIGEPDAEFLSDTVSGVLSGASAGIIAGPIGAAIGAALGGISGMISGNTKIFEAKDDSFKEYYQGQYETVLAEQNSMMDTGSPLASTRENDLRVFSTLLDGGTEAAKRFQQSLIELGRTPPFSYDTVAALSKDMLGLGLSTDEAAARINSLAEAAAALNWSEGSVSSVISYLESAQMSGKMESRVVKSLSKMGVNVYEALAEEFNISSEDVAANLGDLDVDRAVSAIYSYLGERFAGATEGLIDTYSGASGILESRQADLDAAMGEGYNEERKRGIAAQSEWLEEQGDEMGNAYSMIGQWKASLENLAEQYEREALNSILEGVVDEDSLFAGSAQREELEALAQEYQDALADYNAGNEEAGATMGRILAEAQAIAMNEYNASEGYQLELKNQLELAKRLRDDAALNEAYYDAGYRQGEEFSKGMAAAIEAERIEAISGWGFFDYRNWYSAEYGGNLGADKATKAAVGLPYVPEDNFPALLHEGERVLTAREAREYDAGAGGGTPGISITVNGLAVREEADVERIAARLLEELELAEMAG